MKQITLNADDLGLAPAVNQAVLRLAEMGRIQSASFMSLGRIGADEVAQLRQYAVEIGLHLDFTGFADLTGELRQGGLKQVMWRSWRRAWPAAWLRDAIARQLDAYEHQIGAAPVFVDGHQHVHQFPQIREQLLAELWQRYGNRVMLRSTRPFAADAKSLLIYALGGPVLKQLARSQTLKLNRSFGGAYAFNDNEAALRQRWQRWLSAAPAAGAVLMCHPAVSDTGWQDDIKAAREREWQWLGSAEFAELWQRQQCRPQSWASMAD